MNIIWSVSERFAEISTILLNAFFLYRTLAVRVSIKKQTVAILLFTLIRMIYYFLDFNNRPLFTVFSSTIYAFFIFYGHIRVFILWNVIAVVIDGIVDTFVASIYLIIPSASIELISSPGIVRTSTIICAKLLLFASYYIATRKIDKEAKMSKNSYILSLLIPIGCYILLNVLISSNQLLLKAHAQQAMASGSFALLLIIISALSLFHRITADEKALTRLKLQQQITEMTQTHINQTQSLYAQLSAVRHDLNNHLSIILGYANENMYDELKDYVGKLVTIDQSSIGSTHNPIVDMIISTKKKAALDNGIDFTSNVALPNNLPIDDVDLCILLSNILDNAFDACEQSTLSSYIHLTGRLVGSDWYISCRNSVNNRNTFQTNKNIASTKNNSELHGIGTRQIKEIAEKTGGHVQFIQKDSEFTVLITLHLATDEAIAM
jgi:signal transduction histidine kinase